MEHVFPVLSDGLWTKWERNFTKYESGDYIDPKNEKKNERFQAESSDQN